MSDKDFQLLKFISENRLDGTFVPHIAKIDIAADARLANLEQKGYIKNM